MGVRLKDRSGRGVGLLIAILFLANYVNCQEYFIQGSRPVFVLPPEESELSSINSQVSSEGDPEGDILRSRSGLDFSSSEEADSSSGQVGDVQGKDVLGRGEPIDLPEGFDESVKKNLPVFQHRRSSLHGDPGKLDEEDEEGRGAEPRLIWPFSIEITKGKGAAHGKGGGGGWGSPAQHGSFGHGRPPPYPYRRHGGPPIPRHGHHHKGHHKGHHGHHGHPPQRSRHGGKGGYSQEFHFSAGHNKGKGHHHGFGGHHGGHGGHGFGGGHGWGGHEDYEHEKHKLKFEILKLKAKKKIALLQNKVELKKLLSLLLQKKIQALEWW